MSERTVMPLELRREAVDGRHYVEGLCVPYGRTSMKAGHPRGERFVAGAFSSLLGQPGKVRLIDTHDTHDGRRRPAGVAEEFQETAEGLVGRFRLYDTPEGRGAWENLLEETYGGLSVGFVALEERSGTDGAREVVRSRLHHVALEDEPAYEEAKVLALRSAQLPDISELLAVRYDVEQVADRPDLAGVVYRP